MPEFNIVPREATISLSFLKEPDEGKGLVLGVKVEGQENQAYLIDLKGARQLRAFLNREHRKLRPDKDWDNCPYESHSNDCDCRGMGGDR